jgi:hypothetical protein
VFKERTASDRVVVFLRARNLPRIPGSSASKGESGGGLQKKG